MRGRRLLRASFVLLALSGAAVAAPQSAPKSASKTPPKAPPVKSAPARAAPVPEEAPVPAEGDADRERIVRMQAALREILNDGVLRRMRVGIRVIQASTGRLFFEKRGKTLMDPASNQKVLATTAALIRLGGDWRFRTELSGPPPDAAGVVAGDLYLRGSGDPTVTNGDLHTLASHLVQRGLTRVDGAVVADPRRIGSDQPSAAAEGDDSQDDAQVAPDDTSEAPRKLSPRAPLVLNHGLMSIRVRPGASPGWPAELSTNPSGESFLIRNQAKTRAGGRTRVSVRLSLAGARIQVEVTGKIAVGHKALAFRRRVPHQALYAAVLLRAALTGAGIAVRDPARVGTTPASRPGRPVTLLERHESEPLSVLLRRINKDSDNDHAERVLDAAGAEVYGGAPTADKGVKLLREVIGELGLPPGSYVPRNASGLGHANRITADAMADLLRTLYLDPRVGPELLQSLSVGGVDGTTRNRFKGTLAARRVRAKTGTLAGKSCLSGLVGDGPDVLAFSILVEGLRGRSLAAVRGAQVSCVNAMMRYVREAHGPRLDLSPEAPAVTDLEVGQEISETEGEATESDVPTAEDPVDVLLRQERKASVERAAAEAKEAAGAQPAPSPAGKTPAAPAKPAAAPPPAVAPRPVGAPPAAVRRPPAQPAPATMHAPAAPAPATMRPAP